MPKSDRLLGQPRLQRKNPRGEFDRVPHRPPSLSGEVLVADRKGASSLRSEDRGGGGDKRGMAMGEQHEDEKATPRASASSLAPVAPRRARGLEPVETAPWASRKASAVILISSFSPFLHFCAFLRPFLIVIQFGSAIDSFFNVKVRGSSVAGS
jgi:hypothetical protein